VRGFPFDETVEDFLRSHDRVFVVEQNRDAQLRTLLVMETNVEGAKEKLRSILVYGGFPLSSRHVIDGVTAAAAAASGSKRAV
jgi:2-oxoglutarate ferredoxin oxidoreductase subunit alpha